MNKKVLSIGVFLVCACFHSVLTLAEPLVGGDFTIIKSTIDSGGGESKGGDFILTGTIGQHDATDGTSAGGEFKLAGGFWANSAAPVTNNNIFKDGFEGD
jgi:hypothetical protein